MFSRTRKVILLLVGLLSLALLAACGGSASANAGHEVNVTLKTFSITLSSSTVKAGDVTFHVANVGTDMAHEMVIFKTDLPIDKLPMSGSKVDEDKAGKIDEADDVQPGKTKDLTVNLAPGRYVLICNIEGHYMGGMRVELNVVS